MSTFRDRVTYMLGGRPLTVWGKNNQISGGTISRISQGKVPGQQILNLIQRIENISKSWLMEGVGLPFLSASSNNDHLMAHYLLDLMDEPDWQIYVLTDGTTAALVLTQPGEYEFKGKMIKYRILEMVVGPMGQDTVDVLNNYRHKPHLKKTTPATMARIYRGELGTYKLLGDTETPGIINGQEKQAKIELDDVYQRGQIKEDSGEYNPEADILIKYRSLTDDNKDSVRLIIDALLAQQEG